MEPNFEFADSGLHLQDALDSEHTQRSPPSTQQTQDQHTPTLQTSSQQSPATQNGDHDYNDRNTRKRRQSNQSEDEEYPLLVQPKHRKQANKKKIIDDNIRQLKSRLDETRKDVADTIFDVNDKVECLQDVAAVALEYCQTGSFANDDNYKVQALTHEDLNPPDKVQYQDY